MAIRSGLVGEAEPLRRFGVLLNEAAVKAEAYRSGIAKVGAVLTEQQKVQARANLIMQQTKLAQGDATRTADSFTNQMRKLQNQVRDTATELGLKLLPIATTVITKLNEWGPAHRRQGAALPGPARGLDRRAPAGLQRPVREGCC